METKRFQCNLFFFFEMIDIYPPQPRELLFVTFRLTHLSLWRVRLSSLDEPVTLSGVESKTYGPNYVEYG